MKPGTSVTANETRKTLSFSNIHFIPSFRSVFLQKGGRNKACFKNGAGIHGSQ
jgi:hypothetical protein